MVHADTQLLRVVDGWQRRGAWPHAVLLTGNERSGLFSQAIGKDEHPASFVNTGVDKRLKRLFVSHLVC